VFQVLYAFLNSEESSFAYAEKELECSLEKVYQAYLAYIILWEEILRYGYFRVEHNKKKRLPNPEDLNPNLQFLENPFLQELLQNKNLKDRVKNWKVNTWQFQETLIRKLYEQILRNPEYIAYMSESAHDFEAHANLIMKLYRQIIFKSEEIVQLIEADSVYCSADDLDLVKSMVIKTMKKVKEDHADEMSVILPPYTQDYFDFAKTLLRKSILESSWQIELIKKALENWEVERLAMADLLLLRLGITEAVFFPSIPTKVTYDEYIEIAKYYGTDQSASFINGLLERCVVILQEQGKINKIGRGLIDSPKKKS
jgi:N utilization substance protein B